MDVERTGANVAGSYVPYDRFNCTCQVFDHPNVTPTGAAFGALVLVTQRNAVQINATPSTFGIGESDIRWVGGNEPSVMTDGQIQAAIGTDFFLRLADVSLLGGTPVIVGLVGISTIRATGGIVTEGANIDLGLGFVENITSSQNPDGAMARKDIESLIPNVGLAFEAVIQHPLPIAQPVITWRNVVPNNNAYEYVVFRRQTSAAAEPRVGTATPIAVLPTTVNSYQDLAPSTAGPINYNGYAVAYRPAGGNTGYTYTNTVSTTYDPTGAIASGEYGNGSDGAYVDGSPLERSRVYQFTTFVATQDIQIIGDGTAPIVFVQGNVSLTGVRFTHQPSAVQDFTSTITIIRTSNPDVVADLSVGIGLGGQGGKGGRGGNSDAYPGSIPGAFNDGGLGGAPGLPGQDGEDNFVAGTAGAPGVGGQPGEFGNSASGGGSGGAGGGRTGSCGGGLQGAHGVNGAPVTGYATGLLFIVGGNWTADAATEWDMNGFNGQPGINGNLGDFIGVCSANCSVPPYSYSGIGGSSGGSGGSAGSDGPKIVVCVAGTHTDNTTVKNFNGGTGGPGGFGGPAQTHPCQIAGGPADGFGGSGADGQNGQPGVNGSYTYYQID